MNKRANEGKAKQCSRNLKTVELNLITLLNLVTSMINLTTPTTWNVSQPKVQLIYPYRAIIGAGPIEELLIKSQ